MYSFAGEFAADRMTAALLLVLQPGELLRPFQTPDHRRRVHGFTVPHRVAEEPPVTTDGNPPSVQGLQYLMGGG